MNDAMNPPIHSPTPYPSLAEWTSYAATHSLFDLWGLSPGHAREWTRACFDGRSLNLSHGCDGQTITLLELRRDGQGAWRVLLGDCTLSRMSCPEPEAMAWLDLQGAFAFCPPHISRSLVSRARDHFLGYRFCK